MKKASLSTAIVARFATSRLRSATKPFALRLVLLSAVLAGLVAVSLLYVTRLAKAATFTATASGAWNLGATWGNPGNNVAGSGFPGASDTANIPNPFTVTIASGRAEACTTLNLNSNNGNNAALNFTDNTSALSVSGTATVATPTSGGGGTVSLSVDAGTLSCNALTFTDNSKDVGQVRISTGTATVTNSITLVGGAARSRILFTGAGTLNVGGSLGGGGTITTTAGCTVNYNGATQTIFATTYENLTLSNSGTKTPAAGFTVNDTLTIDSAVTLNVAGFTISLSTATLANNGTLDFTDASGSVTNLAGGTSTLTTGANALIKTVDLNGLGPAANASLINNGTAFTTTSIDTNGTVEYNRNVTSGQTVTDRNYNNLTITGSAQTKTWTLTATRTVNGTVTINSSAPLTLSGAQTINVKGDWSNSGVFTASSSTINFNGAANQAIGGASATTFSTLSISNTGTAAAGTNKVILTANTTISAVLNVSSGVFDQGASFTVFTTGGAATVASVSSGATWQNLGTGDLSLSGGVANAGTINFNANGNTCGDADSIQILSSASSTQRAWSGLGTFSMTDVNVKDQTGTAAITVTSGTNSGNNGVNWVFVGVCPAAQTYTWVGPIGGVDSYTVPANWSPIRLLSNVNDVLVIDGSTRPMPSISSVPTETIARLRLINGTDATLTTSAANVLTIGGGTGTDLDIADASRLTLSGASALTVSLATGATGNISSFMVVQGGAHRLLAADAGAVTFPSGALFTTSTGFSGNAFGTTNAGSIVFASGSSYIHNAGLSPFGTVGGAAVCVFQTGSEARYLTATGFDANGRTYSTLTIGDGSSQVVVSDGGSGDFKFDNLVINSTGSLTSTLTYTGSGGSTITIQGNITSAGAGSGSLPDLFLTAGSGGIQINKPGGGTVTYGTTNPRSMDLESDATIATNTTVNLGRILQMGLTPNKTIKVDGTIAPNFGGTGYVIGKEKRTFAGPGPVDFTFVVGTVNGYSPMDAKNTLAAGELTVTATQTTAPVVDATRSLKRYWTLSGSGITSDLTFYYLDPTDIPVTSTESNYRVIRVEGGTAVSVPNDCPSPAANSACVDFGANKATVPGVNGFSDWTLGENTAPTEVRLNGFTATTRDDGVRLEWRSGFEVNNLGYNLYRYQGGQRTRVTPSLIAGSALIRKGGRELASGFSYGWFDSQGTVETQYELEAIDLRGDVQTFAPRYVAKAGSHGASKKDRAAMMTEVNANAGGETGQRGWANGAANAAEKGTTQPTAQSLSTQQSIAAQPAVKIRVNQTGWYRLTQPQLVAAGFDPAVDARKLQLFGDGIQVPIRLSTDKARLGSGDTLEFYGIALNALTTDTRTYYLVSGATAGLRIPSSGDKGNSNGKPKAEVLAPNFLYTVESKERFLYLPGILNGDNDNIFGQLVRSDPAIQTITVRNLDAAATATAQLEVVIQGFTDVAHQVQVQFNGSYVGTINFSGTAHTSSTLPVNPALIREGDNTVTLTGSGSDADASLVDVLRLTYAHTYRAENDALQFSVGDRSALVNGFSSAAIRVIDISNPAAVQEIIPKITNANGSYGFTIQTSGTAQRLVAFADNLARQPASIVRNQPSTWNSGSNSAEMVIVTHGDFRQSADSLASARRAQGLAVSVVDVEDVFDEFSYGAHTPQALRDFLAWANGHWAQAPRYALLFGDSSWDPRNYVGQGYNDFVPTKLIASFELETGSDDWLADFDGDGIPEIAVGRLPARTAAEASAMTAKILSYDQERASGAPLRGALLVADNGFEGQSAQVQSFLTQLTTTQTLNRSAIGNDNLMRNQIVTAINQGPAIVNYFGHGSVTVWTGAGLLNEENGSSLTNGNRLSLFVMMTCLNGYAHDAYIDSLGETVLKDPQGGAVAAWASSGLTDPVGQAQMNTRFYQLLLGAQPQTLGEAARHAKMSTPDLDVRRTWILLGDPSMRLR